LFHLVEHDFEAPVPAPSPIEPQGAPFVHLCREGQIHDVRRRHFAGLAVRAQPIEVAQLEQSHLRFEDTSGHGPYPHYYGTIPTAAIGVGTILDRVVAADLEPAEAIVRPFFPPTPILYAHRLSRRLGKEIWIKLESATPIRTFKIRGALVKLASLRGKTKGVITASAGNHGLAVAWAARAFGVPATVVMPERANPQKAEAIVGVGARTIFFGDDYQAALEHSVAIAESAGLTSVHAYDDPWIIAGQGTLARELPQSDTWVAGIGGGGLVAGLAVGATTVPGREATVRAKARVIGVEPNGADAMHRSIAANKVVELEKVDTLADGLAARRPSALTLRLIQAANVEVVRVDDQAILGAMRVLLEDERLIAEPAGAAALAAIIAQPERAQGKTIVVLSGANISDAHLASLRAS